MRLEFNQGRLAERGVAEMVLNNITACKGVASDMVEKTLGLGIAILVEVYSAEEERRLAAQERDRTMSAAKRHQVFVAKAGVD